MTGYQQRVLAALLVAAGAVMSLEAATSSGHAECEPETVQPAYCKPAKVFLTNTGLGCNSPNGACEPPDGTSICADQASWGTVEPARCVFAVSDSTLGVCLMGYVTSTIEVHYMRTECQVNEGLCSCKGVAINELFYEKDVCNCGDLVIPPAE